MTLHGAMGCLIFVNTAGGYQNGGHHSQRAKAGSHHIAEYIAVVILKGPYKATLGLHNSGYGIVDQGIEIGIAVGLKFLLIFGIVQVLEDFLKVCIVGLGDSILGGKPKILFAV